MRRRLVCGLAGILIPAQVWAGQVYGSISEGGQGRGGLEIEIKCGGVVSRGSTAGDGSYRVNVQGEGKCAFTVAAPGIRASSVVFSYPNPSRYDFELAKRADGTFELRRR